MFTRPELEFRIKACNNQASFRVVAFSIALIAPTWIGAFMLQKLHLTSNIDAIIRPVGALLFVIYIVGLYRIMKRTQHDHGVVCPKCNRPLWFLADRALTTKTCPRCHEQIVK